MGEERRRGESNVEVRLEDAALGFALGHGWLKRRDDGLVKDVLQL